MRLDIVVYTLFTCLLLNITDTVLAGSKSIRRSIELFDYIDGNTTLTKLIRGVGRRRHSRAYYMADSKRSIRVSREGMILLSQIVTSSEDFSISALIKQNKRNLGSIFSLGTEKQKWLSVESNSRRRRIKLHYTLDQWTHVETIRYSLANSDWHRITVTVSRNCVQLYVGCNKILEKHISTLNRDFVRQTSAKLWVGQRNSRQAFFKGAMEYVRVSRNTQEHLRHCPPSANCGTCNNQISKLEESIKELHRVIKQLNEKLLKTESRVSQLEKCDCRQKDCDNGDGVSYRDGESWHKDHCIKCHCKDGQVECGHPACPLLDCPNPVLLQGHCCPMCLKHCYHNGVNYEHGEGFRRRPCVHCECKDGKMSCEADHTDCPVLNCPASQHIDSADGCCKRCIGSHFCAANNCDENASCIELTSRYVCQCNAGYSGDGKICSDIDECVHTGGLTGHHCQANTRCVNTAGSYTCECLPGFTRTDIYNCQDTNECTQDDTSCAEHAVCVNTHGSYTCHCELGYHGDGHFKCTSTDQCRVAADLCYNNSHCEGPPGSYHCRCKPGFQSEYDKISATTHCLDINECVQSGGRRLCPAGTTCVNTVAGYQCVGAKTHSDCQLSLRVYKHGSWLTPDYNECMSCNCRDGVLHCEQQLCDCSAATLRLQCCPQCLLANRCHYRQSSVHLASGDFIVHGCVMCRCSHGDLSCWTLSCPRLTCPHTVHPPGECCAKCAPDDSCHVSVQPGSVTSQSQTCDVRGRPYNHGDTWHLRGDECVTCQCQFGHVCCSVNTNCQQTTSANDLTTQLPLTRRDDVGILGG